MYWQVFYTVGLLSQCRLCYEIQEYEWEIPYEYFSFEYEDNLTAVNIPESIASDHNLIGYEELQVDDEDAEVFNKKSSEEGAISFAGSVKAKGSVSVAATYGYDAPSSYPPALSIGPSWFPPTFYPQHYLSSSYLSASPVPPLFYDIPFPSIFQPEIDSSPFQENGQESLPKVVVVQTPVSKEIYLKISLRKNEEDIVATNNSANTAVELDPDEILPKPVELLDEGFSDYDVVEDAENTTDDSTKKGSELQGVGRVFSGFVPASGTVKIAARY